MKLTCIKEWMILGQSAMNLSQTPMNPLQNLQAILESRWLNTTAATRPQTNGRGCCHHPDWKWLKHLRRAEKLPKCLEFQRKQTANVRFCFGFLFGRGLFGSMPVHGSAEYATGSSRRVGERRSQRVPSGSLLCYFFDNFAVVLGTFPTVFWFDSYFMYFFWLIIIFVVFHCQASSPNVKPLQNDQTLKS